MLERLTALAPTGDGLAPCRGAPGPEVQAVPGTGHSVLYGFCDEFMKALDGWI
jgi:hypothetical protein